MGKSRDTTHEIFARVTPIVLWVFVVLLALVKHVPEEMELIHNRPLKTPMLHRRSSELRIMLEE